MAQAAAAQLVQADVDVVVGGIYSSTRQAIKGPVVDEAGKLYLYPEQYEGRECHPLIFCTGPVPAQQIEPFFPWLMRETGATTFYMPSADYIWPHTLNEKVREVVSARGGEIAGERYFPLDHVDYEAVVADIMATGADVVFNTIVPPFSMELLNRYEARYPGSAMFTAGSAMHRHLPGIEDVGVLGEGSEFAQAGRRIAALDHARIPQGPGCPAEMVPGQHHVRMNMYIARSDNGTFKVIENLGHIDPKECDVPVR